MVYLDLEGCYIEIPIFGSGYYMTFLYVVKLYNGATDVLARC